MGCVRRLATRQPTWRYSSGIVNLVPSVQALAIPIVRLGPALFILDRSRREIGGGHSRQFSHAETGNVTGMLELGNSITTNAATITLTGAPAEIYNSSGETNALGTLVANATTGILSLQSGQKLTTTTNFSNAGKMTVALKSGFAAGGSYTQTGRTTTVDGTLAASSGLNVQSGTVLGKGTLAAAVTSTGTITVGDSTAKPGTLTVTGSYAQNASGALNVAINGTTIGSQYSQLAVSNGVSLGGTLTLKRAKSFTPAIGDVFTILTGGTVTGEFATVNGLSINSGEHFEIGYTPTAVTLTVDSGPESRS